jgi:hypothetical protein
VPEPPAALWSVATIPDEAIFEDPVALSIAREMPSFGGFYYTAEGQLEIALTDASRFSEVANRVNQVLVASGRALPSSRARVVQYSFLDLARYRTVLRQGVSDIPGVNTLGVYETLNRVHVGVENGQAEAAVRTLAASLGIPAASLVFEYGRNELLSSYTPSPRRLTRFTVADSLLLEHGDDLIEGGYQLGGGCTLGFPAIRIGTPNTNVWLTASHCTTAAFQPDGYPKYQGSNLIGYEIIDPYAGCSGTCRGSDAAVFSADVGINLGKVARTTAFSNCESCALTLAINQSNPSITMTGQGYNNASGEWLHKVGSKTGWTYGQVVDVCDDFTVGGVTMICGDRVDFSVDVGDSGSPVFTYNGSTTTDGTAAEMRGILFGRKDIGFPGSGVDGYLSDLAAIETELGVTLLAYQPNGPVANISGPTSVATNMECTWSGSQSTGFMRWFTWKWNGVVVGDSEEYTRIVTASGTLSLTVTDALNQTNTTNISVTASGGGPQPPQCSW